MNLIIHAVYLFLCLPTEDISIQFWFILSAPFKEKMLIFSFRFKSTTTNTGPTKKRYVTSDTEAKSLNWPVCPEKAYEDSLGTEILYSPQHT